MKVGDLVTMRLYIDEADEWGVGVIVKWDRRDPTEDWLAVWWAKIGDASWEKKSMLERIL